MKKRGPETTLEVWGEVFIEHGEGKLKWFQRTAMSQKLETEPGQRVYGCCVLSNEEWT